MHGSATAGVREPISLKTKKDSVYKLVLEYWQGEGKANVG